jgi:hypothetical protein
VCGLRQGVAPVQVRLVAKPAPVHGAEDHGSAQAHQDNAASQQWIVDTSGRLDPASTEGMAERRADIDAERGQVKIRHEEPQKPMKRIVRAGVQTWVAIACSF